MPTGYALKTICALPHRPPNTHTPWWGDIKMFSLGTEFRIGDNRLWVSYHKQLVVHLMHGLNSLVNDNQMENNLKEF